MQLFRPEALEGQDRLHGDPVVVAQVSWRLLGGFFAATLIAGAAFLAAARYPNSIEVSGRIVSDRPLVIARAAGSGTVEDLLVREGDEVTAGRPLARISGAFVTGGEAGTVANLFVGRGDAVGADQPILSIAPRDARLRARLELPATVAASLEQGRTVRLAASGPSERTSHALIAHIDSSALAKGTARRSNGSGAVLLDATFELADGDAALLHPGMTVSGRLTTAQQTLAERLFDFIGGRRR